MKKIILLITVLISLSKVAFCQSTQPFIAPSLEARHPQFGNSHIPFNPDGSVYLTGGTAPGYQGNFIFRTNNGTTYTEHFFIDGIGRVGIGVKYPNFSLALPSGNSNISLGGNIFLNGEGSTGRIANNAYMENGWKIADASEHASTIELRSSGIIDMYGTVMPGQAEWRQMFGFDAPNNIVYFPNGNVGIGTKDPKEYKLAVNGPMIATSVKVTAPSASWPDYVFEQEYRLKPLSEIESFIKFNKHLPNVPSKDEVQREGINLGDMNAILLQKIEELTLYLIQLEKENESIKATSEALQVEMKEIQQILQTKLK